MRVRRIVTGHDNEGNAVFVSDEEETATTFELLPGFAFCELWGAEEVLHLPTSGNRPVQTRYFPPPGGFRFTIVTIPPARSRPKQEGNASTIGEVDHLLPGFFDFHEPGRSGFHTTPTVDIEVMLAGEVTLELDHNETRVLRAGDVVVQNGTRHRWVNRSDRPATYAAFLVGAY